MIDDPKEKKRYLEKLMIQAGRRKRILGLSQIRGAFNAKSLFNLAGIVMLLLLGSTAVTSAIMGLITSVLVSVIFIILGSMSVTAGTYFIYIFFSRRYLFEPLINKAIRRAIQFQN